MSVGAIDHVWVWTRDMDAAVRFYGDILGLRLVQRFGNEWSELDAGAIRIGLHGAGDAAHVPHAGTIVFRVEDLDRAKLSLGGRGVVFDPHDGEVPGVGRYVSFADPDGNSLQLFEYLGGPGGSRSERERASDSPPEGGGTE
jgi:catechol 2,3-dioxygenase-like lactoylglutathione lyase family enzyme